MKRTRIRKLRNTNELAPEQKRLDLKTTVFGERVRSTSTLNFMDTNIEKWHPRSKISILEWLQHFHIIKNWSRVLFLRRKLASKTLTEIGARAGNISSCCGSRKDLQLLPFTRENNILKNNHPHKTPQPYLKVHS